MKDQLKKYLVLASDKTKIFRALKVAIIVGVVLNIINNPQIYNKNLNQEIDLTRLLLTFIVPFAVSLYSSVSANDNHS